MILSEEILYGEIAMVRRDYGPLRDAQQQALDHQQARDALHAHMERPQGLTQDTVAVEREPTRPEGHPMTNGRPAWGSDPSRIPQEASAQAWAKYGRDYATARAALDEHIERGVGGQSRDKTQEQNREIAPSRQIDEIER